MPCPPDGAGVHGDRRSQVLGTDQQFHPTAGMHGDGARHGAASGGNVEHRSLSNVRIAARGKENLQINRDSGMFTTFDHGSLRSALGTRGFLEEFDGHGVLSHFFHEAYIGNIANDTRKLRAIIAHDAGTIDDHIIDQPVLGDMH